MDDAPDVAFKVVAPTSLGWLRRPDLEVASDNPFEPEDEMWEQPDGRIYRYRVEMDEWGNKKPFRIVTAVLTPPSTSPAPSPSSES